jgi:hypothetical protein
MRAAQAQSPDRLAGWGIAFAVRRAIWNDSVGTVPVLLDVYNPGILW